MTNIVRRLREYSDEELLAVLLHRNTVGLAPKKRKYQIPHAEAVVAVGADGYAEITIACVDLMPLQNLTGVKL